MSNKYIQPPRGTHDLIGDDMRRFRFIEDIARKVALTYGFREMQTPIFEFSEVFHRSLGDTSDVVSKETYTFQDRGGESLTLRPEFTAAIVRAFISNGYTQKLPFKAFYAGPAFRYERPQKGRQRQFHQVGVECLGADDPLRDAEIIQCADDFLGKLLINERNYYTRMQDALVNLEINTLGDTESRALYREQLVRYFTDHKNKLSEESQIRLEKNPLRILDSKQEEDKMIVANAPLFADALSPDSKKWFQKLCYHLENKGIKYTISPRLVRGLDYYSHTVFEFTSAELGAQATVLAGGRYNGLVRQMGGDDIAGVGWAAGMERLILLHEHLNPAFHIKEPYVILSIQEDADSHITEVDDIASALRKEGVMTEIYTHTNDDKAYKKAKNRNATHFIIIDCEALNTDSARVKHLLTGHISDAIGLRNLTDYFKNLNQHN